MNELELFKQMINASHYGQCIIDNTRNILAANSTFDEIFGKSKNQNIQDLSNIFEDSRVIKLFDDTIANGINGVALKFINQYKFEDKDYSIGVGPIGSSDYYLVEVIDNNHASISRQHLDILFENSPSHIAIINQKLQVVRSNKKFKELFGETGSKTLPDLYKRKNSVAQHLFSEECFKDGKTHSGTQIVYPKDDKKVYLFTTVTPLVVKNGVVTMIIGISQDITEINNIHDQMIDLTDYFHRIFEKSSQGMLVISNKGKIIVLNNAAKVAMNWAKSRKPGIVELSKLLEIDIFDHEHKEYEKVINIVKDNTKYSVRVQVTVLEPSNDRLILLNKLDDEHYTIQKRLNWSADDIENYYHLMNKTIAEKRKLKPVIVDLFKKQLENSGNKELISTWNKGFSKLVFADFIIDQLSSYIEDNTKKRTTIKTSTVLAKLEEDSKEILNHYGIDIKFKTEFHEKITTNSDVLHTALMILIYASAGDLTTMDIIRGSIKVKFSIEKYKSPYILIEDNFYDTQSEKLSEDSCLSSLESVAFLLKLCKCKFNYVFEPNVGRKFWINFEKI
ncbi:MAG: PAS domain-containing protein [bacterium]